MLAVTRTWAQACLNVRQDVYEWNYDWAPNMDDFESCGIHMTDPMTVEVLLLGLSANNLSGHALPAELTGLPEITELNLHWNYLSGTLPAELPDILPLLEGINFENVQHEGYLPLSGTLPTQLGHLLQLQYFQIRADKMSGSLPSGEQLRFKPTQITPGAECCRFSNCTQRSACSPSCIYSRCSAHEMA